MAILENIRKRTTVLILIIGLALFAFVISGIFTGNDFGGVKTGSAVAEVNGDEISIDEFRRRVESASRYGNNSSTLSVVNNVYDQEIRSAVLGQQISDLGINIEQDQIINFIRTNPYYTQNPQFLNESGVFDENKFREWIVDLKATNPQQYALWLQDEANIIRSAREQAYYNLIKAGVGATLKEGEFEYKLANDKIDIRYARVPYTSIADSSITVTKGEIAAYIEEHKEDFEQENARDIQFVYFQEKPSATDETALKAEVVQLLEDRVQFNSTTKLNDTIKGFRDTEDLAGFLGSNSDIKFDTIYKAKKDLPAQFADTLMTLQEGQMHGPYRDGDYFKISKMVKRKPNGSVKASHILIAYQGAERADPKVTRTQEEAEEKANEVLKQAVKSVTDFAVLANENSDGPSASKGGDLGYFQEGVMTPKFNDFAFNNPVGHVGLVETEFGYHIVKVDDKEDIVQIAHLAREIVPSEETINDLFTEASNFEIETTTSDASFPDIAKEKEYAVRPVNKIKEMDENLPGLSAQRSIVQWAFNSETKVGDIKRFNINNGYAVAQVTATYAKGLMSTEDASSVVLPKIRQERKAAQIIAANKGKTIDDFAKENNTPVSTASALSVKSPTIPGAGNEPLIVGTAFALAEGATSGLIEGSTGVFMVTVVKKTTAPKLENYSTYANTLRTSSAAKVNTAVYNALKEASDIEDNRATFY